MKPHDRSAFPDFHSMDAYVIKFKEMPVEARFKLMAEAAESDLKHKEAPRILSFHLENLRERLVKSLLGEFETKYPGVSEHLRDALHRAVLLTDRMLKADTEYNEYARLMLANWAFALNMGSPLDAKTRRDALAHVLEHCAQQFKLDFDLATIDSTEQAVLSREQAGLFVAEMQAREAGSVSSDALAEIVSQSLSSNVYAQEQKAAKGKRGYIAFGRFSGKYGHIERALGVGKEAKYLMILDDGQKVIVDREQVADAKSKQ
jgi:hypothetical protein